jgi:4-hydroxy-tetrahydrodipicolinate synthase
MFTGLSAFPLTPLASDGSIDEAAFARLVRFAAEAKVDSICALGSTGCYAYFNRAERARVARIARFSAADTPVMIGIGAVRLREVLELAEDAQQAGAGALLLAPSSYHALNDEEVFGLYEAVSRNISIPLCVYDNPGTTNFIFSDELHGRIASLPNIGSIKIPGVPADPGEAEKRVANLRSLIPEHVTIGVSGDSSAVAGLLAGCDAWYSVIGGLFPNTAQAIARAAQAGDAAEAHRLSNRLAPLWSMFEAANGSLRVVAAAAEVQGFAWSPCLPAPLQPLQGEARYTLFRLIKELAID